MNDSLDLVGAALNRAATECDLVVVDEIGKTELFSADFTETVWQIINSGKRVLETIMVHANPLADAIKCEPRVNLVEVTRANYHGALEELLVWSAVDQSSY